MNADRAAAAEGSRYVARVDSESYSPRSIGVQHLGLLAFPLYPMFPVQQPDELEFKVAINRDGWALPGLNGSRVETRRQLPSDTAASESKIFLSNLKPKGGTVLLEQRAHYYPQQNGSLLVQRVAIRTSSILRYDVEGKPFGYVYLGGGVRIMMRENDRLLVTLGCGGGVAYYDEDGDGIFERMDTLGGTMGFQPLIPEWVKRYIRSTPQHNKRVQRTRLRAAVSER